MYKHRCGAELPTIAAAFVHLLDCPLEEPRRTVKRDRHVEVHVGDLVTRYERA